jgi:NAD/NADP transhydrogenase beta subunit
METKESTDLQAIERKAFKSTQDDGLLEMQFGAILVILGISAYIDDTGILSPPYYGYLLIAATPLIVILGRRYITQPRLGQVRFGVERLKRQAKMTLILSASVLFGVLIFALAATDTIRIPGGGRPYVISGIIATTIFLTLAAMGYFMNNRRFVIVGAIFGGSELSITFLKLHTDLVSPAGVALTTGGVLIVIMAAWVLAWFLRDHPKQDIPKEAQVA